MVVSMECKIPITVWIHLWARYPTLQGLGRGVFVQDLYRRMALVGMR
jgi:hypothetical protein